MVLVLVAEALTLSSFICLNEFRLHEERDVQRDGDNPEKRCHTRRLPRGHGVERVVRVHHPQVAVHSNSGQKEDAAAAVHGQHEEGDAAESIAELPVDPREVVAGAQWKGHVEQEIGQRQVEEEHRAAPPRFHVIEDPEGQAIANDAKHKLQNEKWR